MVVDVGLILAYIATVGPAWISIISRQNSMENVIDECYTLRARIAYKLAGCQCPDFDTMKKILASTPCDSVENMVYVVRSGAFGVLVVSLYFLLISISSDGFMEIAMLVVAVSLPYMALWMYTRPRFAGILADAQAFASSEIGSCNHPSGDNRESSKHK